MHNNKIASYLFYAIGEIILVVIGILIAVSLNNWNEQKKLARKEVILKEALHEELLVNQKIATDVRNRIRSSIQYLDSMIYHWDHLTIDQIRTFPVNEFGYNFLGFLGYTISYHQFLTLSEDIYRTAVSDGSIALIQNREFVRDVEQVYAGYAVRVNDFMEDEDEVSRNIHDYISREYGNVFLGDDVAINTQSDQFHNRFLTAIQKDGTLRYKLIERSRLKKSRMRLVEILIREIEDALETYELDKETD